MREKRQRPPLPAILLLWLLLLAGLAAATPAGDGLLDRHRRTPTVALLPFADANDRAKADGLGLSVAAMFGTHLKNETSFTVLERSQLSRVLQEQSLSSGGLTETQRQQLGRLYQVEAILTGEVARVDDLIQLDARLVSVETGQVLVAECAQVQGYKELRPAIVQISKALEMKYLRRWMGNLAVSVQPVEGEVYLDDQFIGKSTLSKPLEIENLLEGTYQLKVLASGYSSYSESVALAPRMRREIAVALKALPGSLRIQSEPVGAKVRMNNRPLGTAPLSMDTLPEGTYHLVFETEGFQTLERDVEVRSGQQSEVKGVLEVQPGTLVVGSVPSGAQVYVDDRSMGVTPLVVENLVPGTHPVRLELGSFAEVRDAVTVRPGEQAVWSSPLRKLTGTLSVVSSTDSVRVVVKDPDGKAAVDRLSPFHRQELAIGTWQVELSRPDYRPETRMVKVEADQETRLETALTELPATLAVTGSEPSADVWVDTAYVGRTGQNLSILPKGAHRMAWSSFFAAGSDTVVLRPDERREVATGPASGATSRLWIPVGLTLSAILLLLAGGR
jgi:TolB-like protein